MPVSLLLVEGDLDFQVLNAICGGNPTLDIGGPKYSLGQRVRFERKRINACYLRDRDFDFDPPADLSQPAEIRSKDGVLLGWRWCRHEIENYLIDPELVADATGWDKTAYVTALGEAARSIRHYQVARWVVGQARRSLPPNYQLTTKPEVPGHNEFRLPDDLTEQATMQWAREHVAQFFARIQQALAPAAIDDASIAVRQTALTEPVLTDPAAALVWCSGKDLLAALRPWLQAEYGWAARDFLYAMRDWVKDHPDAALQRLPEWNGLLLAVRA
jgi:hypothetical protein